MAQQISFLFMIIMVYFLLLFCKLFKVGSNALYKVEKRLFDDLALESISLVTQIPC